MKKFLSVALTLTMIVSMLTATVSAATMSDIFTNEWSSTTPVYGDVMLDVAVSAKRSGYTTYSTADLQLSDTNLSSGIGVDYKATLDMLPVTTLSSTMLNRDFVSSALNDDAAETEFYAGTVATNIEVKITYPSAAVVDNVALDAAGIDNSAYVENGSRTFSAEGENTVATINYKQQTTRLLLMILSIIRERFLIISILLSMVCWHTTLREHTMFLLKCRVLQPLHLQVVLWQL